LAAVLGFFINEQNHCDHIAVAPIVNKDGESKWLAAMISEMMGTFFFVFLFMLSTDVKTQFSKDKVINCFIIASSYVAARLMSGGTLVTGLNISLYEPEKPCVDLNIQVMNYRLTGPLLNPALAFGQMMISW
jgi:glycerol uptake facilitator-like aquaporin